MTRALLLSFVLALPLSAATWIDPPNPTTQSAILLRVDEAWHEGCVPNAPSVTRNGNAITVTFVVPAEVICVQAITAWRASAFIGLLPAGIYDITVRVNDRGIVRTIATHRVPVRNADPTLTLNAPTGSTAGGTSLRIVVRSLDILCEQPNTCVSTKLTLGGVGAPDAHPVQAVGIQATTPPHAAGPVDVVLEFDGRTYSEPAAFTYADPSAPPESDYERVLLPIIFSGPGALGSLWRSDARLFNRGSFFDWLGRFVSNNSELSLSDAGDKPRGQVLFFPRFMSDALSFSLLVRDVSRQAQEWGTEIPVARERDFRRDSVVLLNVPLEPKFRQTLRVYGIDGVRVRVDVMATNDAGTDTVSLDLQGSCAATPCFSSEPEYGAIADLSAAFPRLVGHGATRIEIRPPLGGLRYWAFVSATNNDTQHVTISSPQ